ncbi:MAG: hypothetical protein ACWGPR_11535 [Candidatus Deferrimicrobiaceae bacterium]
MSEQHQQDPPAMAVGESAGVNQTPLHVVGHGLVSVFTPDGMFLAAEEVAKLKTSTWLEGLEQLRADLDNLEEGRHLTEENGTRVGRMIAQLMAMAPESARHIRAKVERQARELREAAESAENTSDTEPEE